MKSSARTSNRFDEIVNKLSNLSSFEISDKKIDNALSFMIHNHEFFIPISSAINMEDEKKRLMQELDYNKGFLKSVQSKLANDRFVSNAKPEVVEGERKKEADALAKIRAIEEQLSAMN